jgi:predicted nuclease with TOPRIM domain
MSANDFHPSQFPDRRASDGITVHLERLHSDVGDMREALKELAASVSRLALVEERLGNTNQALERLLKAVEKLENRMTAVEAKVVAQGVTTKSTSKWVDHAIYALLAAGGTYLATKGMPK